MQRGGKMEESKLIKMNNRFTWRLWREFNEWCKTVWDKEKGSEEWGFDCWFCGAKVVFISVSVG